jgi:hypothetical protein
VPRVKPSTHSAVRLRCCALYIAISCAWLCDIVAVNAVQNNNTADTRTRSLQLSEFTLRPVLILFGDEGEMPASSAEMDRDSEG